MDEETYNCSDIDVTIGLEKYTEFIKEVELEHIQPLDNLPYNLKPIYYADTNGIVYKIAKGASKANNTNLYIKLSPFITRDGYVEYVLTRNDGKKQHLQGQRITAMLYIPNPENKCCVNHIDGDRTHNAKSNLEWMTVAENNQHSYDYLGKVPWNKGKSKYKE